MIAPDSYAADDVILINRAGRVLLLLRDDIPTIPWPGCWDLPGGVAETGESAEEAARREVFEECGYAVGDLVPFARYEAPHGIDGAPCDCHVFSPSIDAPIERLRLSADEGQALRFFTPHELDGLPLVWGGRILADFFASPRYLTHVAG